MRRGTAISLYVIIITCITMVIIGKENKLIIARDRVKINKEDVITDEEKLFTLNNIRESIDNNKYIQERFKLVETNLTKLELDVDTDMYDYSKQINISSTDNLSGEDNSIKIEIGTTNRKATYLSIDIIDNKDSIKLMEHAVKDILIRAVGDKITEELIMQDNGVIVEHEIDNITTIKNTVNMEESNKVKIEYYIDIAGEKDGQIELDDFVIEDEKQNVFNWIPRLENDITSRTFATELAKLYSEKADFKIVSVETDNSSFTINTKLNLQITTGECVYGTEISLIGMELTDSTRDTKDAKLHKTISVRFNLPHYKSEEEAISNAKIITEKLFKTDIILEKSTGTELETGVRFVGDNSTLIEVSKLTGVLNKSTDVNGGCAISVEATLEDNTLIDEYENYLAKITSESNTEVLIDYEDIYSEELN